MIGWIARHDCVGFWTCLGKPRLVVGLGSWMLGSESQVSDVMVWDSWCSLSLAGFLDLSCEAWPSATLFL